VAVALVVVYHVAPAAMPAGFLGVSLFFTLSGFLITRLLLDEHLRTGSLALRRFWSRRYRRLTPAALLTLGVVTAVWMSASWMTAAIGGDVVASLAQVANWRFLFTGTTYGAATEASPVLHFWSLAIEEQFYLAYPLIVWVALRRTSHPRRTLGILLTALLAASLAYTVWAGSEPLTVYFSTFSRAGEVIVGALLAVVTLGLRRPSRGWVLGLVGALALAAFVALSATTRLTDPIWAHGGLTAVALLSAAAVVGATQPGLLGRPLALRPLVRIGELSYGIYLFHWPILVGLRTTELGSWVIGVVTVTASVVLAELSLRLLENPVRLGSWNRVRLVAVALPLTAIVGSLALWSGSRSSTPTFDFSGERGIEDLTAADLAPPGEPSGVPTDPIPTTPTGPVAISLFGDSTAWQLRLALTGADPRIDVRPGWSDIGCTLTRGGPVRGLYDTDQGYPQSTERCDWTERWPATVAAVGTEVAIVYGGVWDTVPRQNGFLWDGWRTVEDPTVAAHVRSEMVALTDALHAAGARQVVWLTLAPNLEVDSELNRRRVNIFNQLLSEAAGQRPDVLKVVDIAGWFATQPPELRPDGVHVTEETGRMVLDQFLAGQLLTIAGRDPAPSAPSPVATVPVPADPPPS
jgi:peptidoglycan/LPS O-acetylase OafA/YrhL